MLGWVLWNKSLKDEKNLLAYKWLVRFGNYSREVKRIESEMRIDGSSEQSVRIELYSYNSKLRNVVTDHLLIPLFIASLFAFAIGFLVTS